MVKTLNKLSFYLGLLLIIIGLIWWGISAIFGHKTVTNTKNQTVTTAPVKGNK